MIEIILIIVLTLLVITLAIIAFTRGRSSGGTVLLDEAAVNDLLAAVGNNSGSGRIQEIAGGVSNILKKHLRCEKIVFLRYYRSNLEVNYYTGVKMLNKNSLRIKLKPTLLDKLKSFDRVAPVEKMGNLLSKNYLAQLQAMDLRYFFPVFLREKLYGVYLIKTELAPDNPSLNLLATTLAFNLSTAYHIGLQDQKIARYENKIQSLESRQKNSVQSKSSVGEVLKFLKFRKCQQLVPELLKMLKKDANFSKLGFYVKSGSQEPPLFSVSWNMGKETDKIIEDSFDLIVKNTETDSPVNLKNNSGIDPALHNSLEGLQSKSLNYMMSIPWINRKKAILVWSSNNTISDVVKLINEFKKEALPLVENISRFEKAEELSYTDGLTGIYNYRYFKKRLNEELKRAKRYNHHLALLIFDIDDLKNINDKYGHQAGDELIKSFGRTLQDSVRENDVLSRYGGDEFCLLMPENDRQDTQLFMERIEKRIASDKSFFEWAELKLSYTVSIGGAVYPDDADSDKGLIHSADMALLKAKEEGRSCARIYEPQFDRK